jgi:hypothetical protein
MHEMASPIAAILSAPWRTFVNPGLALAAAGVLLPSDPVPAFFATGAVTLLLVYIGIHNSWDTVTFITVQQVLPAKQREREAKRNPAAKSK